MQQKSSSKINLNENSMDHTKSGLSGSQPQLSKTQSAAEASSMSKKGSKEDGQVKRQSSLMVDTIGDNAKSKDQLDEPSREQ